MTNLTPETNEKIEIRVNNGELINHILNDHIDCKNNIRQHTEIDKITKSIFIKSFNTTINWIETTYSTLIEKELNTHGTTFCNKNSTLI